MVEERRSELTVDLPFLVVPKARPRVCGGRAYTPKRTLDCERKIALYYHQAALDYPKTHVDTVRVLLGNGDRRRRDLDNQLKTILDSLNKIAYDDDCQLAHLAIDRVDTRDAFARITLEGTLL